MKRKRFADEQMIGILRRGGIGNGDSGVVPQALDVEHDVLQVAHEVRRDGLQ